MEELIKLCKHEDIEFESTFLFNRPYKYSNKEELRKLFWLTELKQFIFTKFEVFINIDYIPTSKEFGYSWHYNLEPMISKYTYPSESLALIAGIEYFLNSYIESKND